MSLFALVASSFALVAPPLVLVVTVSALAARGVCVQNVLRGPSAETIALAARHLAAVQV